MENCPYGKEKCSDCPIQREFCHLRDQRAGVDKLRKWEILGDDPVLSELPGPPWWKTYIRRNKKKANGK